MADANPAAHSVAAAASSAAGADDAAASSSGVYELLLGAIRTSFFPTDVDIFQEYEKDPYTRRRFEAASALEMAESWRPDPEKRAQEELAREREQEERVHIVEQLLERRRKIESEDSEYTVAEVENADGYNPLRNKASVSSAASAMAADAGATPRPSVGTHELLRTGSVQRPPASS
ncbi:hypothetical protein KEM56_007257 [Ascosphaera pollenicola]|nr:hypothetical protein KEM56_007257 [Ascosphaera pollenicola]